MAPATAVLLPKVFPSDLISLGQLIRNPLVPNINSWTKGCSEVIQSDITEPDEETPYQALVSTDTRGRFDIGLTKFLGINIKAQATNLLAIEAEKLVYTTLKDSSAVFKRICADDETKKWIGEMVLNRAPCYLVIGIQQLHKAEFKRAVLKSGGGAGYATVPLEATAQIPLHLKAEVSADRFGSSKAIVNGIFGVQVQRVRSKIAPSGVPGLEGDVAWKWSYQRVKGSQGEVEEAKELHVGLEGVEVSELVELLKHDDDDDDNDEDEEDD